MVWLYKAMIIYHSYLDKLDQLLNKRKRKVNRKIDFGSISKGYKEMANLNQNEDEEYITEMKKVAKK